MIRLNVVRCIRIHNPSATGPHRLAHNSAPDTDADMSTARSRTAAKSRATAKSRAAAKSRTAAAIATANAIGTPDIAFFNERSSDFVLEDVSALVDLIMNSGLNLDWSRGDVLGVAVVLLVKRKAFDDDETRTTKNPCAPHFITATEIAALRSSVPGTYITNTRAVRILACMYALRLEFYKEPVNSYAIRVARIAKDGSLERPRLGPYRASIESRVHESLELGGVIGSIVPLCDYLITTGRCAPYFVTMSHDAQLLELRLVYWLLLHLSGPLIVLALAPHVIRSSSVRDLQTVHGDGLSKHEVRSLVAVFMHANRVDALVLAHRNYAKEQLGDSDDGSDSDDGMEESCHLMAKLGAGADADADAVSYADVGIFDQPTYVGASVNGVGDYADDYADREVHTWNDVVVACVLSVLSDLDSPLFDTTSISDIRRVILRIYEMDAETADNDARLVGFVDGGSIASVAVDRFLAKDTWFEQGTHAQRMRVQRCAPFIIYVLSRPCEMELLRIVSVFRGCAPNSDGAGLLTLALELCATLLKMKDEFKFQVSVENEQAQAELRTQGVLDVMRALFSGDELSDAAIRLSLYIPDAWSVERAADRLSELYQEASSGVVGLERGLQWTNHSSFGVARDAHCFTNHAMALIAFMRINSTPATDPFGVARLVMVPYAAATTNVHNDEHGAKLNQLTRAQATRKLVELADQE